MIDTDTFVTILYVLADDFCKANLSCDIRPGPNASLSRSEVITLAVFGQWTRFESERGFYRFAQRHLQAAFPSLPHRSQLNRLIRRYREDIVSFSLYFVDLLQARTALYEIIDSSAVFGMKGTAEIMTDRQSVLLMLLSPLRQLYESARYDVQEGAL